MTLTEVEVDRNALQISELRNLTGSSVCSSNLPLQVADGEADASNHLLGGVTWSPFGKGCICFLPGCPQSFRET